MKITLEQLPNDTDELRHWQDVTLRTVASATTSPKATLIWVRAAFDLDTPEASLVDTEPFDRLDLAIAGDIETKILKLRNARGLPHTAAA